MGATTLSEAHAEDFFGDRFKLYGLIWGLSVKLRVVRVCGRMVGAFGVTQGEQLIL
jgi:hypothetical protein